jgi:N-acetylmuramate 1-kinase
MPIDPQRAERLSAFLCAHKWNDEDRSPLACDASFRRYERLIRGSRRAVLMDAPPPDEDVRPFVHIARHLQRLGFSAPEIYAEDPENGFLLLEDFGDNTYARALIEGGDEEALYGLAADVLSDLHERETEQALPESIPPYDEALLMYEVNLFTEWYAPVSQDAQLAFEDAWKNVFPLVHAQPRTLVLRDYHMDNLIWLSERKGLAACGLLDFQDAVAGPAAYDLVSLLEDARRDIDEGLIKMVQKRYFAARTLSDTESFEAAYAILGAQRHTKVIGIFSRLLKRDGKNQYLAHIPRTWRLLERSLEHPSLGPVRNWFDRHIQKNARRMPQ